jgi:hypothetical protein
MVDAILIEFDALQRLLSSGGPPPGWSSTLDFHDTSAGVTSIEQNGTVYVRSISSQSEQPTLVLGLSPSGLFTGFAEKRRTEVLLRACTAAEAMVERGGHLPASWRPWTQGDFVTFQATSIGSNDSRRLVAWRDFVDLQCIYVFNVTEKQADYDRSSPDWVRLKKSLDGRMAAAAQAATRLSLPASSVSVVELERRELRAFTQAENLEQLYRNYLTAEQRRFVDFNLDQPIRLHGAAGTGKTLAMVVKTLRESYAHQDLGNECRYLFLTHNDAAADLVRHYLESLDERRIADADTIKASGIEVSTLLTFAAGQVLTSEREVELISNDAFDAKRLQFIMLAEVIQNYRRGAWVTRRSRASDHIKAGIEAAPDSNENQTFCWDLMNEIAIGLDGERVRDNPSRRETYRRERRPAYRMSLPTAFDRDVILDLYDAYRASLRKSGYMSTDHVIADFLSYLESYNWEFRRERRGYDALFVDEFHLFNTLERLSFQPLLRGQIGPLPIVMAADPRQSPRETFLDLSLPLQDTGSQTQNTASKLGAGERFQLQEVFRFTPQILELLKFINQSFPVADFVTEWEMAPPTSRRQDGAVPVAEEVMDRLTQYKRAFEIARRLLRENGTLRVAILSLSFVGFTDVSDASQFRDQATLVQSREERLPKVIYEKRRPTLSMPEYVAGYQFDHVILTDVSEKPDTEDRRSISGQRRFLSAFYLGASRAKETVTMLGLRSHGGLAEIVLKASERGIVQVL